MNNSVLWLLICIFAICLLAVSALYGLYLLFIRCHETVIVTVSKDDIKEAFRNKENLETFVNRILDEMKENKMKEGE